jgi:hypothetical protein
VGEDDTEAQKTALVLATPPRKPGTCVEMSALRSFTDIRWPKVAKPICPLCASADIRLPLSSTIDHSLRCTVGIDFLLDIVDFGQRPEPRSSKHEFRIEQFQG